MPKRKRVREHVGQMQISDLFRATRSSGSDKYASKAISKPLDATDVKSAAPYVKEKEIIFKSKIAKGESENANTQLLKAFNAVESALFFAFGSSGSAKAVQFADLQQHVHLRTNRSFELSDLGKIMTLAPKGYVISFASNSTQNDLATSLKIQLPSHTRPMDIQTRKRRVIDQLMVYAQKEILSMDFHQIWENHRTNDIARYKDSDIKKLQISTPFPQQERTESHEPTLPKTLTNRSTSLRERIRQKELACSTRTVISESDLQLYKSLQRLVAPSPFLSSLFSFQLTSSRSSFHKAEITAVFRQGNRTNSLSEEQAIVMVDALALICPTWVQLCKVGKVDVVKFIGNSDHRDEVERAIRQRWSTLKEEIERER